MFRLTPETGTPVQHVSSMWAVNISGRGIRLASSLTDAGEWNWKTFITGASVNADCINAGTINGDHIKGGTIEGSVYRYGNNTAYTLINGSMLYTTNGSNSIQIDGYGIRSNYQSGAALSDYMDWERRHPRCQPQKTRLSRRSRTMVTLTLA